MTADEKTGSGASGVSDSERLLFGGALAYDIGWYRHEGAWLGLGLWSMARRLPRLVGTGLRLARLADPRALPVVLASEAGRGIAEAVGLVTVNSVLGHVLADGSTDERFTGAVPALEAVAATAFAGSLLRSASTAGHQGTGAEGAAGGDRAVIGRGAPYGARGDRGRRAPPAPRRGPPRRRLDPPRDRYCTTTLNAAVSLIAAAGVLTVLTLRCCPCWC
ncbi:hypothetical protein SUDANB120_05490 [Streptomyces sp. enrichment culture]